MHRILRTHLFCDFSLWANILWSLVGTLRELSGENLCLLLLEARILPRRRQWHPTPVLLPGKSHGWSLVGYSPWGLKELDTTEWLHFHALEKEMATHSSVLAWRIPGMGEPGGLPSMGSHRVGHDWSDLATAAHTHTKLYSFDWCVCVSLNYLLCEQIVLFNS